KLRGHGVMHVATADPRRSRLSPTQENFRRLLPDPGFGHRRRMSASNRFPGWRSLLRRHETILLLVLIAEWLFFYWAGTTTTRRGAVVGFGTLDRQFDILRHSCEIGLLALALTPVILTGGIDLSVGSL